MLKPADNSISHELRISNPYTDSTTLSRLAGMRVTVIGAGPAGLIFARNAAAHGAHVRVLEKAPNPSEDDSQDTDRSFNMTLDEVGRLVLGTELAWEGGTWLRGRAIHQAQSGGVRYGSYGKTDGTHLVSIPRPVLRRNLVKMAREHGVEFTFDAQVVYIDPNQGSASYITPNGATANLTADLVVVSDGLHSLGDALTQPELRCKMRAEPRNYLAALLQPQDAHGLSLEHIHFWHEPGAEAYAIGIPNSDGSVGLLLTSAFEDLGPREHPFATPQLAEERLRREYPQLWARSPQLATQLPLRPRGRFLYKMAESFKLGDRAIVVGDAGCAVPPWAGFGANSAMYAAAALVYELIGSRGELATALAIHDDNQQRLGRLIMEYVQAQGEFLSSHVIQNPDGRSDSLLPLVSQLHAPILEHV